MINIRSEKPEDFQAIYEVNRQVFQGEAEAKLVNNLRKTKGFISQLSLVAEKDGRVVGHILFSVIHINTSADKIPVLALAPMAVLPQYQNNGIGTQLVKEGLKRCKDLGHKAIVVVGHKNYYPRFGFTPAKEKGLRLPFDAPDEAFMICEVEPKFLDRATGVIEYPPEFADV